MKRNSGVSLIEILVSLLIIALIVGPFTGMFIQSTRVRSVVSKQLRAIYLVRNEMEKLMAKNAIEAYNSNGDSHIDGFYVRTSVVPYSIENDTQCFNIIVKTLDGSENEVIVFTPNGYRALKLHDDGQAHSIEMYIDGSFYEINIANQRISGNFKSSSKPSILINLIDKNLENSLDFSITGDAEIKVYPGSDETWSIANNGGYSVVDRCYYRDYSIFRVEIEAFDDISLNKSFFKIINIIRVPN